MTGLLAQSAGSATQSFLGTALYSLIDTLRWLAKTVSAHKLLLAVLALSLLYNTWHSSRDTSLWWQERRARGFMHRLGVAPNAVMSKAVHVSDLDVALASTGKLPYRDTSSCYAVFSDAYSLDDLDAPLSLAGEAGSDVTARRVQRTRQRLGVYRHDLLVAMRVVNSVEREMLLAEWECWVLAENRRCRQVDGLVENGNATMMGSGGVSEWYDDYCVSCASEVERLGL